MKIQSQMRALSERMMRRLRKNLQLSDFEMDVYEALALILLELSRKEQA